MADKKLVDVDLTPEKQPSSAPKWLRYRPNYKPINFYSRKNRS